jgi:translation initiation factor IF-3
MPNYPRPGAGSYYNKGGNNRNASGNYIRKNDKIRAREVRVIDPEGKQLGVMDRDQALLLAKRYGLDLVEIAATANPPVCRILDFGKYMYELSKKSKDKPLSTTKMKEIKFRVNTEQHDYMTKMRRGEEFLYKGNKLKVTLMFRGREMEHKEFGIEVLKRAIADLAHVGTADCPPRVSGRIAGLTISPLPQTKRKLKYNTPDVADREDSADDSGEDDTDESKE